MHLSGRLLLGAMLLVPGAAAVAAEDWAQVVSGAVQPCWMPPAAAADGGIRVEIAVALAPDGSVTGTKPISEITDDAARMAMLSAERALLQCGPFTMLPEADYPQWRELAVTFDASGS